MVSPFLEKNQHLKKSKTYFSEPQTELEQKSRTQIFEKIRRQAAAALKFPSNISELIILFVKH